jgi:putative ABC transport system permease protein
LRKQVLAIDSTQPLDEVKPMEERLNEFVAQPRFNMMLLGTFAALALVLSAIGVYGVMAYSVTQRTHEIGIRMALGAKRSDVLQMILNQAVKLAGIGGVVGVVGALMATRALSSLLFGVKPADPATFIGITALLAAITVLAGLVPAFKATRVDPMIALHYE